VLSPDQFLKRFTASAQFKELSDFLRKKGSDVGFLEGLSGSSACVIASAAVQKIKKPFLFLLPDKETAAYFFNDLENLLGERDQTYENRRTFFFPSSLKKPAVSHEPDKAGILLRSEVMNRMSGENGSIVVVSYPEAFAEKTISRNTLRKNTFRINKSDELSVDFLMEVLVEYGFERVEFVVEPGQFSIRGGIVDVFSFSNDYPFRIEIMGDEVESMRTFDPGNQLSRDILDTISILPDLHELEKETNSNKESLLRTMPSNTIVWSEDTALLAEIIHAGFKGGYFDEDNYLIGDEALNELTSCKLIEFRRPFLAKDNARRFTFHHQPQPNFNKQFELLINTLVANQQEGITNIILFDSQKQINRIRTIFETLTDSEEYPVDVAYEPMLMSLHEGFTDLENNLACYTDHQIFDRYHRYRLRDKFTGKQALSIKALHSLKPGDYVTHIDHGIGIFSGLEKIEVNGRMQEAIRLVYKNNDILYVSIHSLHRISRYTGKEGVAPSLHRLGSNAWTKLKDRTKKKVKDIAADLIKLYAKRKARKGHAFSPDTYLQHELEASFVFEDTPDQEKVTQEVKSDMESAIPMDRLICGDVGFGKTEIAIRAAFKSVSDSKQVAVLVPTTILALQHYYTFSERLADFPCNIDYVSRFRSNKEKKQALEGAKNGKVDILIGTHRLLSKDVEFRDLGLLVIDEEQKFGVTSKEKLKQLRVNVDTLTMTATPIPRTLQFSLMGARDLSFLNTPPKNRYPIITEVHVYNDDLIKEAIGYEVSRGGQVFFVHNRVQNIREVADIVQRACPGVRIAVGHGQLEGTQLEKIMVDFIHGEYDVLISTTIIESGLDIPNANTILINNAHHFGLSDLHQMRGRVGRSNKKAFCYLLAPPFSTLTDEARKRLKAIEEFSELGSGFNIAMRDLDIRGAGNLLGAEQSGFISEVGLETYHRILDEAITELRETEFKEVFATEGSDDDEKQQPTDCHLETDLELMIPSDYVSSIEERLNLYKDLDSITEPDELSDFANKMQDRFGPLPESVKGLLKAVRLRWLAQESEISKIILKSNKLIAHLPERDNERFYQSKKFGQILQYVNENPGRSQVREAEGHLVVTVKPVQTIDQALEVIRAFSGLR